MLAVKTNLKDLSIDIIKRIMGKIRARIPVGFEWHKSPNLNAVETPEENLPIILQQLEKARLQVGTLGGGNHFIELQKDQDGYIWFMIHSGSRNLGKRVADHYNKIAKDLNENWYTSVDPKWDLAFLPISDPNAVLYMKEMKYCVDFALRNREVMAEQIREVICEEIKDSVEFEPAINIAHNYAAWENHGGKNVIVHRKGATSARLGELGIIPGSQGTASYIVEGLGNAQSFNSCSHGAGRKMGRKEAQRKLDLKEEIAHLDGLGIVHGIRNQSDLDEAAGAYKDIEDVMKNQQDLVKIVTKLVPLGVVKG
jgi:tRNA-splicing ligase RtcB